MRRQPESSRLHGPPHVSTTVTASDGARLHAEIAGRPDAPLTVVLCHGYTLNRDSWCFQRAALAKRARVVSWDQRGHGRSGHGSAAHMTIDQLGDDLYAVLNQTVPYGPVVLVGHSMGGMTILALAEQHPELFGDRIVGVGLLTTSAGPITSGLDLPPQAASAMHWAALRGLSAFQRLHMVPGRTKAVRKLAVLLGRHFSFSSSVPDSLMTFLADMIKSTSIRAVAELLPRFFALDKIAALPVLDRVQTLVVAADRDAVVSAADGETIAKSVANARLVVVPNAGHLVILEYPGEVNALLGDLLTRVTADTAAASAEESRQRAPEHRPR